MEEIRITFTKKDTNYLVSVGNDSPEECDTRDGGWEKIHEQIKDIDFSGTSVFINNIPAASTEQVIKLVKNLFLNPNLCQTKNLPN